MNKFQTGVRLLKASWEVVKARPAVAGLLIAGSVLMAAVAGAAGAGLYTSGYGSRLTFLLVIQIAAVPMAFTNFAVAAIADRYFRGEELGVSEALALAGKNAGRILQWSLLSAIVGFLLSAIIERFKLGGWIASRLLGLAWALATTFVIPILVIEDLSVMDSVSKSANTFKSYWGESVTADAGVGLVMLVAMMPLAIIGGLLLASGALVLGVVVMGLGFLALIGVSSAIGAVKNVALYRLASEGVLVGNFAVADLNASFKPKKR